MVRTEVEVRSIIEQYVNYIVKKMKVRKVILFGSYAKGTATEDSDIDIAIESPDFDNNYLEAWQKLNKYIWRSGVDPILEPRPLHPAMKDFFLEEILKTGIIVYEEDEPMLQ